jgi:hypothetical protein
MWKRVRVEVFMAVNIQVDVSWVVVMPCSDVASYCITSQCYNPEDLGMEVEWGWVVTMAKHPWK